jgi:hypothetical protein
MELCLDVGTSALDTTEGSALAECPPEELLDTTDAPVEDPATLRKQGSFNYDQEHSQWPLEWEDLADFKAWHWDEELLHSIEIISSSTAHRGKGSLWVKCHVLVCRCSWSGGKSNYIKKDLKQKQKIGSKKIRCHYRLVIKHYLHTPLILGHLEWEH